MKKVLTPVTILSLSIMLSVSNSITGQTGSFAGDTIDAGSVIVVSKKVSGESGYRKTEIRGYRDAIYYGSSLASLISGKSTISIRNYGPGGLSTSSFRGMGANQTRVIWEGIPVNSPASGQVDLSQFIPGGFQNIDIYHGAMPGPAGSGGPEDRYYFTPGRLEGRDHILLKGEAGSYGTSNTSFSAVSGAVHSG
ncbi:MAG: Plug domain-containing protein [Bacteroidales bacterium]